MRKKVYAAAISLMLTLLVSYSGISLAENVSQPCPSEAEIIIDGIGYSDISGIWDGSNYGWILGTDEIMTAWSLDSCGTDIWVEYGANLTKGNWNIGICAVNWLPTPADKGLKDSEWYPYFEVSNSLTSDIIYVPASNTDINSGFFSYEVLSDGLYTVKLRWLNDKAEGDKGDGTPEYDANIKIVRVFFDKDDGCTLTPGYWKNHPEAWPVEEITIGGITYSRDEAIEFMGSSVVADKTISLFRALVAANLNILSGADVSSIASVIAEADSWMAAYPPGSGVTGYSAAWQGGDGDALLYALDDYNNGVIGPGACADGEEIEEDELEE